VLFNGNAADMAERATETATEQSRARSITGQGKGSGYSARLFISNNLWLITYRNKKNYLLDETSAYAYVVVSNRGSKRWCIGI
jgi:hypothetical protein